MRSRGVADSHDMLRAFDLSMQRRNLSTGTRRARMSIIRRWLQYLAGREPSRDLLEQWLDDDDLGPRARYGRVSHLHMFYRWALREGYASSDPTELVERPRLPRRLPRPARMADVDFALAVAGPVVEVAMLLMVDGGLRCCEVACLQWDDVDLEARRLIVTGKGDRDRAVGIPARLAGRLEACRRRRGPVIGRRMSATRVSQVVNAHLRDCGLPFTAHQLRHLYATRLLTATRDITAVQSALGHASVLSTQIYAQVDASSAIVAARDLV